MKFPTFRMFIALMVSLFCLWSCGTVDVAAVRAQIEAHKQQIVALAGATADLQKVAEQSGSPEAIAAAGAARKALEIAQAKIPEMEAELNRLENAAPWWRVAMAAAWPFVLPALKLIPGPGGAVANIVAQFAYTLNATRSARERDEDAYDMLKKVETCKTTSQPPA